GECGQTSSEILRVDNQRRRQLNSVVAAQAVVLSQSDGSFKNSAAGGDELVFSIAAAQHVVEGVIALVERNSARRPVLRGNRSSGLHHRQLAQDHVIPCRWVGQSQHPGGTSFWEIAVDERPGIEVI